MNLATASGGSTHLARECALLLLIAIVPAIPTWWSVHAEKAADIRDPWDMTVSRARETRNRILWIDTRAAERFAAGHIPDAKPLELAGWNRQLPAIVSSMAAGNGRHPADGMPRRGRAST